MIMAENKHFVLIENALQEMKEEERQLKAQIKSGVNVDRAYQLLGFITRDIKIFSDMLPIPDN